MLNKFQQRRLNLYEYQSKNLFKLHNLPVEKYEIIDSVDNLKSAFKKLNLNSVTDFVVKPQVLTGGRGKGYYSSGLKGGIHFSNEYNQLEKICSQILGYNLITHQTDNKGLKVKKIMLSEKLDIKNEFYLALTIDRKNGNILLICSNDGGVDIEDLAKINSDSIHQFQIALADGLSKDLIDRISIDLFSKIKSNTKAKKESFNLFKRQLNDIIHNIYNLFTDHDLVLIEINPLVFDDNDSLICADVKLDFDDNAEFRQKKIFGLQDKSELSENEILAKQKKINYVQLDGDIGCMVNGAGLAMATMDIIKYLNGSPANFLDLGGGANFDQIMCGIKIITSNENVKAVFLNIFGGITKCDTVAEALVSVIKELNVNLPFVVRLIGNAHQSAKKIIGEFMQHNQNVKIYLESDLAKASAKVIELSKMN